MQGIFRSVAILTVAGCVGATTAMAGALETVRGWGAHVFVAADVGLAVAERSDADFSGSVSGNALSGRLTGDRSGGWAGSVVVGAEFGRDFALMAEGQYLNVDQRRDLDGTLTINGAKYAYAQSGLVTDWNVFAGYLTAHYRVPVTGWARPYLGAGLGVARLGFDDGHEYAPAMKVLAGMDLAIGPMMSAYAEYNYLLSTEVEIDTPLSGSVDQRLESHLVRVGLKKRF